MINGHIPCVLINTNLSLDSGKKKVMQKKSMQTPQQKN